MIPINECGFSVMFSFFKASKPFWMNMITTLKIQRHQVSIIHTWCSLYHIGFPLEPIQFESMSLACLAVNMPLLAKRSQATVISEPWTLYIFDTSSREGDLVVDPTNTMSNSSFRLYAARDFILDMLGFESFRINLKQHNILMSYFLEVAPKYHVYDISN